VAAGAVLDALAVRGLRDVVAVPDTEAAGVLASGVADITGHDAVAVCVIEPDSALVALVTPGVVTVDRIERPLDRADALELTSSVIALLDVDDRRPEAIFVVGSDDVDVIVSSFGAISDTPVFSAAEAELALARGAALASAREVNGPDTHGAAPAHGSNLVSRTRVLSAVLGAAVVTFVVSLSMALYVNLHQESVIEQPQNANAAEEAAAPRPALPPPGGVRKPPAVSAVAKTLSVRAPVAPPPVYQPPAPAYVPPAPAYVPPAPAYVPPAPAYVPPSSPPPVQQPRLRDRIIERIPIIGRFHEPQYPG
jgi:hypothetical protein